MHPKRNIFISIIQLCNILYLSKSEHRRYFWHICDSSNRNMYAKYAQKNVGYVGILV